MKGSTNQALQMQAGMGQRDTFCPEPQCSAAINLQERDCRRAGTSRPEADRLGKDTLHLGALSKVQAMEDRKEL